MTGCFQAAVAQKATELGSVPSIFALQRGPGDAVEVCIHYFNHDDVLTHEPIDFTAACHY